MFHKLVFRKQPRKKVYLKTYLSNTPNTVDQIQIQIQIHGLKFDQIQIQIQIRRICICICICICKYKYVFDPSPELTTISFIVIFHKYCCCTNHGGLITNLTLQSRLGHIIDMSKYHNAGVWRHYPDSKVHGAKMGPTWGRQDPGGLHVGPMNFAAWVSVMFKNTLHIRQSVIIPF